MFFLRLSIHTKATGNIFTFMMFLVAYQYIISEKIEKLDIFHMIRYRIPFIKWHKSIFFILIEIQQFRLILALQKNDTTANLMLDSFQDVGVKSPLI